MRDKLSPPAIPNRGYRQVSVCCSNDHSSGLLLTHNSSKWWQLVFFPTLFYKTKYSLQIYYDLRICLIVCL